MIELNSKNMKKIMGLITFAVILYWGLQNLNIVEEVFSTIFRVIFPFILGLCIAFVLNIPVRAIERVYYRIVRRGKTKKINENKVDIGVRILSIILSICIIVFILYFVMFLVIPELINTFDILKTNLPNIAGSIRDWLVKMTQNYPDIKSRIASISIDWNELEETLTTLAKGGITAIITSSFNFVVSIFTGIFNLVMGLVFALYLLVQKEKLQFQLKKIILAYLPKEKVDSIFDFGKLSNDTFSKFLGGQFIEACILGLLCFIGMNIFSFPYTAAISVLIGVTALIPFFGAFIGVCIGTILIFAIDPTKSVWFVIYFLILQQIEGNLIYPKVVGNSVGLPAIWVILAVTIGGSLFGIAGMLVGVPFVSVLYKTIRKNVHKILKNKEIDLEKK